MNREEIQEIILRVLSEQEHISRELSLDVPVEVSAKHVHLTQAAVEQLFGAGAELTPKRPLSQTGQYLCEERVSIVTAKGRMENVAVLGPVRPANQVEISATDSRILGIKAPLRMSGDLSGAADVYLVGPKGMVDARESAIVARTHIHITPDDAEKVGITDGQKVAVTLPGERSITLNNVICRVSSEAGLAMHIDFDEANACMLPAGATARMTVCESSVKVVGARRMIEEISVGNCQKTKRSEVASGLAENAQSAATFDGKLITEAKAREIAGKTRTLSLQKGVILTPSAKDVFRDAGVKLIWLGGSET